MSKRRYPGVKPFTLTEKNQFFGRDWDINQLFKMVNVKQLVVLYSKSGLGKSSLINAGLLPKIEEDGGYQPINIRFGSYRKQEAGDESQEYLSPLKGLQQKVIPDDDEPTLLNKLAEPQDSLWYYLKSAQLKSENKDTLLIFDQFEELFTYPKSQIRAFGKALSEVLYSSVPDIYQQKLEESYRTGEHLLSEEELEALYRPLRLKVLVAIRSDKLSLIDQLKEFIPNMLSNTYQLQALQARQAEEAIIRPAYLDDPDFESPQFDYTDDAIDKILSFLTDDGTTGIESFQLQILCQYIEETIVIERNDTYVEYHDVGDLRDIFETYYDKLISRLQEDVQLNVRRLLEEGLIFEDDERRLSIYEGQILRDYDISRELLQQLVDSHIIRAEPNTAGGFSYELSHDSLVRPILRAFNKRREEEKLLEEERRHQQEYEAYKAEMRARNKKIRKRVMYGGVALMIILITGGYLFFSWNRSQLLEENLERMEFLATTADWYRNLVLNFDLDSQKPIYLRDFEESNDLRNAALDLGSDNQQLLQDTSFVRDSVLLSLNLAYSALTVLPDNPEIAIKLAREAVRQSDNDITEAVNREVLALTNMYFSQLNIADEQLLDIALVDDQNLVKITPFDISVVDVEIGEEQVREQSTQRSGLERGTGSKLDMRMRSGTNQQFHLADIAQNSRYIITADTLNRRMELWEWDGSTFESVAEWGSSNPVFERGIRDISISADGGTIGFINTRREAYNFDPDSGEITPLVNGSTGSLFTSTQAPAFSASDARFQLLRTVNNEHTVVNTEDQSVRPVSSHTNDLGIYTDMSGSGKFLLQRGRNNVSLLDLNSGGNISLSGQYLHQKPIRYATTSPGDSLLVTQDTDGRFYVWAKEITDKPIKQLDLQRTNGGSAMTTLAGFSSLESSNAAGSASGIGLESIRFSPSGNRFITVSPENITVWETRYVKLDPSYISEDSFYEKHGIFELTDEEKLTYNVVGTEGLFTGRDQTELLAQARNYYDTERYQLAIDFYSQVLQNPLSDSVRADVLNEYGNSYYALAEYQQAMRNYEQVIAINPQYKYALGNLGLVHHDLKNYERSISYHKQALAVDPDYTASLNGIGNVYYAQQKYEEAIPYYERAIETDSSYKWAWRNLAMCYYYLDDFEQAMITLQDVQQVDPNYNISVEWNQVGNGFYEQKKYDEAFESYSNSTKNDPSYKWAHYNLGNVEYFRGNYYDSYVHFKRVMDLDPEYRDALFGMIDAYEMGYEDSRFDENSNWVIYCRGKMNAGNKKLNQAFQDYRELAARRFRFPEAFDWNELGNEFYNQGESGYAEASESYQRALEKDPEYVYAWINLGMIKRYQGDFTEAFRYLNRAREIEPTNMQMLSQMAGTRYDAGQYDQAVQYQQETVDLYPDNTNNLWALSWYQLFDQQFEQAVENSKKVIQLDETQTGIYTNMALGYLYMGKFEEAMEIYEQWKDQPYSFNSEYDTFRDAFLKDLDDLEAAGITHPDITRARNLLKS